MTTESTATVSDSSVILAISLQGAQVGGGLGKAHTMAVARVVDGAVASWEEHEVGWDELHGQGPEGTHHGRIVRFMRDNSVEAVVTGHIGAPMINTLTKLGVLPIVDATGDAREVAVSAAELVLAQR